MRIRPTELGWKGFLLLLALFASFLASNYNNLFFLLIVFCSVLGALGLLWSWTNLRRVQGARIDLPAAPAGESRECRLELQWRGRPARGVVMSLRLGDELVEVGEAHGIEPQATLTGRLPPRPRSLTRVRALRLTSRFPFGLFRARIDLPVDFEVVTHPRPTPSGRVPRHGSDADGDVPATTGSRGSAIAGLRPFRSGDALGDLHWKATARRGVPIVREREPEAGRGVDCVLDRRCDPAALEQALCRLTDLVLRRHGAASRLTVHSQGGGFSLRDDRGSEASALRWLAAAAPLPMNASAPPNVRGARRLPRGSAAEGRDG